MPYPDLDGALARAETLSVIAGILRPGQVKASYDGSPSQFIADKGESAVQGYATDKVYVPNAGRRPDRQGGRRLHDPLPVRRGDRLVRLLSAACRAPDQQPAYGSGRQHAPEQGRAGAGHLRPIFGGRRPTIGSIKPVALLADLSADKLATKEFLGNSLRLPSSRRATAPRARRKGTREPRRPHQPAGLFATSTEDTDCLNRPWLTEAVGGGGSAVDLGRGSGRSSDLLLERYRDVLGVDTSAVEIEMARQRHPTATFAVRDLMDQDGRYDMVFSVDAVHHLNDRPPTRPEFARHARRPSRAPSSPSCTGSSPACAGVPPPDVPAGAPVGEGRNPVGLGRVEGATGN